MAIPLQDFLVREDERAEALRIYARIDRIGSPETQRVLRETWDSVGRNLWTLVSIHACDGCGTSMSATEGFCERCGNSNDDLFERLWALVEAHPIGKPISRT